ncbi:MULTISPECIES: putative 2-aminoethylphosphonate ABC transporter ATP-binding protein [Cupriavidus]
MNPAPAAPMLSLERVAKRFGKTEVLHDINLAVDEGEFLCFLGPSGCGKSTLLRIIAGLEAQSGGRLCKRGVDISRLPAAARDVGILFQSYALFPNLTVAANVAYGLVNRRMARADIARRVEELLALVGLPGIGGKHPGQLSGGQQQRVALARALAPAPGILLLDEPLSALDAKVRVHLRQQIKQLQAALRLTTIMVTHDQEEALTMADRIVVMNHGVIEQIGTPAQIYHHPASRFVADFVGKMNFLPARRTGAAQALAGQTVLNLPPRPDARAGEAVTLGFRPEEVCFRGLGEDAPNSCGARVSQVEFLGATWRATLACPQLGDVPVLADFSSDDARTLGLHAGQDLRVAIRPEHLHLFPAGEPA